MKIVGMILNGIGCLGFLIGGSGLDGPTATASVILTAASFVIATVGYKLREQSEREISLTESESTRKEIENEAAKEVIKRAKEVTFDMWVKSCGMDGSV